MPTTVLPCGCSSDSVRAYAAQIGTQYQVTDAKKDWQGKAEYAQKWNNHRKPLLDHSGTSRPRLNVDFDSAIEKLDDLAAEMSEVASKIAHPESMLEK